MKSVWLTNQSVPDRKKALLGVQRVRKTGSILMSKPLGRTKCARTPDNIAAVKGSVEQSPGHSARKRALVLRSSERIVRQTLHAYLHLQYIHARL